MSANAPETIEILLDVWEETRAAGERVSLEQIAEETPQLLPELSERVRALVKMDSLLNIGQQTEASAKPITEGIDDTGPNIPGFLILERIGRGGTGVVYKAWDEELKRTVAIKLLHSRIPEERERFRREGEAQAQLQHPNILQIHQIGAVGGETFFVLEYAALGSLAGALRKNGPAAPEQAARFIKSIAEAVAFAHEHNKGIIHRDIKPGNILVMRDGAVKLADFGLAKQLDRSESLTPTSIVFGTPAYMAPEQASGKSKQATQAADIYSLGATFYALLTGKPPFSGDTTLNILTGVVNQEPPLPRKLRRDIPKPLEAVCMKCLRKEPAQRYGSAQALADDLGNYLDGKPIVAKLPLLHSRRQKRALALVAAVVFLLVAFAGAVALVQHFNHPDRPLQLLKDDLDRNQPVTLVGPSGGPAWSLVDLGTALKIRTRWQEDFYSVHSPGVGLMQLLDDPRHDHFRLEADLRHDDSPALGDIGLYFSRYTRTLKGQKKDYFWTVTFADRGPGARRQFSRIWLHHHRYQDTHAGPKSHGNVFENTYKFVPAAPKLSNVRCPWRRIALEFLPKRFRISWSKDGEKWNVAYDIPRTKIDSLMKAYSRKQKPPLEFVSRAPVGVYVHNSTASIRNVHVIPLTNR